MSKTKSFFSRGRKVQTVDRITADMRREGMIMHQAKAGGGSDWAIGDSTLRNFGGCSYMSLGQHPALIAGAEAALHEFGANFSISRIYLECPLYEALEQRLGRIMERHVLVAPSTTLAHLAALPVLVGDRDLVLVDQFVHASIHMATETIADVPVEIVRHSRVDLLEQRPARAAGAFERVWYLCDGVYSMLGDYAPFVALSGLLERHPNLHLYVDDAHGMSWTGLCGRGTALTHLGHSERVIVATSLSKAFESPPREAPSRERRLRVEGTDWPRSA